MQATVRVEPFDKLKTGCAEAESKHASHLVGVRHTSSRCRARPVLSIAVHPSTLLPDAQDERMNGEVEGLSANGRCISPLRPECPADPVRLRFHKMALRARYEHSGKVRSAKADVRRTIRRNWVCLEHASCRREHCQHRPGSAYFPPICRDDVAFCIEAHAVDSAMYALVIFAPREERLVGAEAAVFLDRIRPQLARDAFGIAAFCDVERLLVG